LAGIAIAAIRDCSASTRRASTSARSAPRTRSGGEIVRFLERYIDDGWPVLDIACDQGHFSRHVNASERWATDIRDVSAALPSDVRFVQASGLELLEHCPTGGFGTVFMSNYLEHLDSSEAVI